MADGHELTRFVTEGAGGLWLTRLLGDLPADLIGLVGGDWLHEQRRLNIERLKIKVDRKIEEIKSKRLDNPNPALVVPLLLAARDESNDTLQDLWATLIAASLTDRHARVRKRFIEVVSKLEPSDAIVLAIYDRVPQLAVAAEGYAHVMAAMGRRQQWVVSAAQQHGIDTVALSVSVTALFNLDLLNNRAPPTEPLNAISPLGRLFLNCVDPEKKLTFPQS